MILKRKSPNIAQRCGDVAMWRCRGRGGDVASDVRRAPKTSLGTLLKHLATSQAMCAPLLRQGPGHRQRHRQATWRHRRRCCYPGQPHRQRHRQGAWRHRWRRQDSDHRSPQDIAGDIAGDPGDVAGDIETDRRRPQDVAGDIAEDPGDVASDVELGQVKSLAMSPWPVAMSLEGSSDVGTSPATSPRAGATSPAMSAHRRRHRHRHERHRWRLRTSLATSPPAEATSLATSHIAGDIASGRSDVARSLALAFPS